MGSIQVLGSALGTALQQMLCSDEIEPGSEPSYQLCKGIYLYHPLGAKMAEAPIALAQSQKRTISVPASPGSRVKDAFEAEWRAIGADRHIFNVRRLSRVYGVASIAMVVKDTPAGDPIDYTALPCMEIAFNVMDPLNTAGSLVLNQDPNALDFQKHQGITVNGQSYHRSRTITVLNEEPIYIGYTSSAFGYVGRSVYQRALFPLKSFVQTMVTDDMVTRKAGVLIAKMKQVGSIIDQAISVMFAKKRQLLKEAKTDNVISIGEGESVDTLNMQNLDGAYGIARTNILKNIATAAAMPAKLLENETLVQGFGEGTEDAKNIARYIDREREEMSPIYMWFDKIVQYRAWNEEFYKTIQKEFPEEYKDVEYNQAFYSWVNSFAAEWPSLLTEPDSEKIKVEETKFKAIVAMLETMLPNLDPDNKARLIEWAQDNFNENHMLFQSPLDLDMDALRDYVPPEPVADPAAPSQFSAAA